MCNLAQLPLMEQLGRITKTPLNDLGVDSLLRRIRDLTEFHQSYLSGLPLILSG